MYASDNILIQHHLEGDKEAFPILYQRHYPTLLRIAKLVLHGSHEAEDVVQDAFVLIWTKLPNFDNRISGFDKWSMVITWRLAVRVSIKRARRRTDTFSDLDVRIYGRGNEPADRAQSAPQIDELCAQNDFAERVLALAEFLNPREREAFVRHYILGLPFSEVGRQTGVCLNTTKTLAYKGLQRIKPRLIRILDR